jgi:hypothetical protein
MKKLCLCEKTNEDKMFHLYECIYDNSRCQSSNNKKSKCGNIDNLNTNCKSEYTNKNDAILKIAELATKGTEICGMCVAFLYAEKAKPSPKRKTFQM